MPGAEYELCVSGGGSPRLTLNSTPLDPGTLSFPRNVHVLQRATVFLNLTACATASALIFQWGRRGEARRAESGDGVLGEGTASPSPPARVFAGEL